MKMRTRTVFACFVILTFNNIDTANVEVSSKVNFDSDENKETLNNVTFVTTFVKLNDSTDSSESVSRAPEPSRSSWRHRSELVKSNEPRKRRIYFSQDDTTRQPKVINNIQIAINSNDSLPNGNSCKDSGICNISVSSKPDGKGNIITEVHLSIITNAKPDAKVDDIPVIESFQGIKDHEEKPIFHPISVPNPSYSRRDNIPQIQTHYQGYGEPWYHHRRTFQRPRTYWNYRHFGNGDVEFRGRKTRPRDRPVVDDKIEPPLSRTKLNDDT